MLSQLPWKQVTMTDVIHWVLVGCNTSVTCIQEDGDDDDDNDDDGDCGDGDGVGGGGSNL
jgi:hypothetical protein